MTRTFVDEGIDVRAWKVGATLPVPPTDLAAITVTQWATGLALSPQMVVGNCTLEFSDPETIDEQAYSEPSGASQTPTKDNFNVELQLFGDRDVDGELSILDGRKIFTKREEWIFAQRAGVPYDTPAAAGQDYTYFKVMITVVNDLSVPDGATEKISVRTLPRAVAGRGALVAA